VPDKNAKRQKRKHYGMISMSPKTPKKQSKGLEVEQTSRGRPRGRNEAAGGVVAAEFIICCITTCTASNVLNGGVLLAFLVIV
jgi:hypothetical protein